MHCYGKLNSGYQREQGKGNNLSNSDLRSSTWYLKSWRDKAIQYFVHDPDTF